MDTKELNISEEELKKEVNLLEKKVIDFEERIKKLETPKNDFCRNGNISKCIAYTISRSKERSTIIGTIAIAAYMFLTNTQMGIELIGVENQTLLIEILLAITGGSLILTEEKDKNGKEIHKQSDEGSS